MAGQSPQRLIRLNKYIADCGVASRRKADTLIESGQVTLNGKKVYELGVRVDPHSDKVLVEGKPIRPVSQKLYLLFNKPKNVLSSMSDPEQRPCLGDYFNDFPTRVFPIGRLDWDSEGMLIMTNDGDFANRVMHPRAEIPKYYLVKVDGKPTEEDLEKLRRGVSIIGGKAHALFVEKIKRGADNYDWIHIAIDEGRNRQIRRMFEKIGFDVMKLQRVSIGMLHMGPLERGEYRFLTQKDLDRIFAIREKSKRSSSGKRHDPKKKERNKRRRSLDR